MIIKYILCCLHQITSILLRLLEQVNPVVITFHLHYWDYIWDSSLPQWSPSDTDMANTFEASDPKLI